MNTQEARGEEQLGRFLDALGLCEENKTLAQAYLLADERDDRLILFIDRLEKPLTWHYSLRAVTAGDFAVPQIYAECMYDAGVASVSGGGRITVNEAK